MCPDIGYGDGSNIRLSSQPPAMSNPPLMTTACSIPAKTHITNNTTYDRKGKIHTTANGQANVTINITDKKPSNLFGLANVLQQAASTENSQPKDTYRAGGGYDDLGKEVRSVIIPNLPSDLLLEHAERYFDHFWIIDPKQSGWTNAVPCKEQHIQTCKDYLIKLHREIVQTGTGILKSNNFTNYKKNGWCHDGKPLNNFSWVKEVLKSDAMRCQFEKDWKIPFQANMVNVHSYRESDERFYQQLRGWASN